MKQVILNLSAMLMIISSLVTPSLAWAQTEGFRFECERYRLDSSGFKHARGAQFWYPPHVKIWSGDDGKIKSSRWGGEGTIIKQKENGVLHVDFFIKNDERTPDVVIEFRKSTSTKTHAALKIQQGGFVKVGFGRYHCTAR